MCEIPLPARVEAMLNWCSGALSESPEPSVGLIVDIENKRRRLVTQIEQLSAGVHGNGMDAGR